MHYLALACDYDGTLATHGKVDDATLASLKKWLATGRKLIMVTGREVDDLAGTFAHFQLFERIAAENGALLLNPTTGEERPLADRPPPRFAEELTRRGVGPISVGRVIVATWQPHEHTVLEVIKEMGLPLQVIFNKGAVMVLPSGVTKATGLKAALKELGLPREKLAGVGDAENDFAFLEMCGFSCAVANALSALKEKVKLVTPTDHGAGVGELIDYLLDRDAG